MPSRLNPMPVVRAHWRGLQDRRQDPISGALSVQPDTAVRIVTVAVPVLSLLISWILLFRLAPADWHLDPGLAAAGMTAAGLMFGSLLAAFALLASWRQRVAERDRTSEQPLGWMIDESVAHIMLAVLESVVVAAASVAVLVIPVAPGKVVTGIGIAVCAHLLLLFLLVVPRLYSAYTEVSSVPSQLDGFAKLP